MELQGQASNFYCVFAKIYGLYDLSGNIFYVGLTTSPVELRLSQHLCDARQSYNKSQRVKRIRELDGQVRIEVLDILWLTSKDPWFNMDNARKLERHWIRKYIDAGTPLTNGTYNKPQGIGSISQEIELWLMKQSADKCNSRKPILQ